MHVYPLSFMWVCVCACVIWGFVLARPVHRPRLSPPNTLRSYRPYAGQAGWFPFRLWMVITASRLSVRLNQYVPGWRLIVQQRGRRRGNLNKSSPEPSMFYKFISAVSRCIHVSSICYTEWNNMLGSVLVCLSLYLPYPSIYLNIRAITARFILSYTLGTWG